jgi:hypothetical protein
MAAELKPIRSAADYEKALAEVASASPSPSPS